MLDVGSRAELELPTEVGVGIAGSIERQLRSTPGAIPQPELAAPTLVDVHVREQGGA